MPKLTVNGNEVEFEDGITVLQACEQAGEEIPRFCYHERLKIAGNCRMCLVEIEGGPPKPAASCAMPAVGGMKIHTNSPMVKKAREGVMEFLLINHPLDCPICDQGGECDLQDQAMTYGLGSNRYTENKRAVKDKNMGPLVKTHMTRCIHCTRCIRFIRDVAGVPELGAIYRGEHMEITTALEQSLTSELSGNVIDLCPVGALTSKPYAFKARPWELDKTESIDVMDAVGSNIRVDSIGREVMRILPRLNEDVNEEWISDKTRFAYDGLKLQRLDKPYIRNKGKLVPASWDEALDVIAKRLKRKEASQKTAALLGDLVDVESAFVLKSLMDGVGSPHYDCRIDGQNIDAANRASYIFNTTIAGIEEADACLLVGTNPRLEASILNARIRKAYVEKGLKHIAYIGEEADLTYDAQCLGDDLSVLAELAEGKGAFADQLKAAKRPMIVVGSAMLARDDSGAVLAALDAVVKQYDVVTDDWNGFNVLQRAAGRVGALDIGFVPGKKGKSAHEIVAACQSGDVDTLYLLGVDDFNRDDLGKAFVIYQGHHGDQGAHIADVILPGASYTEKNGTYVNTEGRVQRARLAVYPPGDAKQDWDILSKLAGLVGAGNIYDTEDAVRDALVKEVPHLAELDSVVISEWKGLAGEKGKLSGDTVTYPVMDYYMTNPICRASKTMAKCEAEIVKEAA